MAGSNIFYPLGVAPGKAAARPRIPSMLARDPLLPREVSQPIYVLRDPYTAAPRGGLFGGAASNRRSAAVPRPKPPETSETWAQSIGHGVHDFGLGTVRGVMDVGGTIGWGADSLGSATGLWDTHAQDAVDRGKDWVAAREYHPGGWADMGGRVVGNVLATAPLAEVKALQAIPMVRDAIIARKAFAAARDAAPMATRLVAAGRFGDMAAQGAASGLVASGGHDVVRNMAVGAIAAPVAGAVTEVVRPAVANVFADATAAGWRNRILRSGRHTPTPQEKERIYSEAVSQAVREGIRDGNPVIPQRAATNLAEARAAAGEFAGVRVPNNHMAPTATPSKGNISKWTEESTVRKSSSLSDHALAVANADELYRTAKPVVRYKDPYGERTIQMVRLRNNLRAPNGIRGVKLTIKETSHPNTPNPYYAIQALDLPPEPLVRPYLVDRSKLPTIFASPVANQLRWGSRKDR